MDLSSHGCASVMLARPGLGFLLPVTGVLSTTGEGVALLTLDSSQPPLPCSTHCNLSLLSNQNDHGCGFSVITSFRPFVPSSMSKLQSKLLSLQRLFDYKMMNQDKV